MSFNACTHGFVVLFSILVVASGFKPAPKCPFGNGVNLAPSYYDNESFGWDLMKQYADIKTVRIEIEPNKASEGKGWIQQAINKGYDVIATCHNSKVLGSNDANELLGCGKWWAANYEDLSSAGSFTVNLMNEWGNHDISPKDYASAYENALAEVRKVYSGPVIIDAPGWGQESQKLVDALQYISDTNLILSMHIYPQSNDQGRSVQASDIYDLSATGLPCVLGEFGTRESMVSSKLSGSVDISGVVKFAKASGCAVLGWAWNGDGGTMNMVTPAWKDDADEDGKCHAESFSKGGYFDEIYRLLGASSETENNIGDGRLIV